MTTLKFSEMLVREVKQFVKPKRKRNRVKLCGNSICFWAIRHKPTGHYLPEVYGRQGRGGSHVEPVSKLEQRPRMFVSKRGATSALGQWLLGKFEHISGCDSGSPDSDPEYYEETWVVKVESRKREEMEIIELKLRIP